jgi:hypothetical protein
MNSSIVQVVDYSLVVIKIELQSSAFQYALLQQWWLTTMGWFLPGYENQISWPLSVACSGHIYAKINSLSLSHAYTLKLWWRCFCDNVNWYERGSFNMLHNISLSSISGTRLKKRGNYVFVFLSNICVCHRKRQSGLTATAFNLWIHQHNCKYCKIISSRELHTDAINQIGWR